MKKDIENIYEDEHNNMHYLFIVEDGRYIKSIKNLKTKKKAPVAD